MAAQPTAGAYALLALLSTFVSLTNYLIPPVGMALLGERLPPEAFAALALVLAGVGFPSRRR